MHWHKFLFKFNLYLYYYIILKTTIKKSIGFVNIENIKSCGSKYISHSRYIPAIVAKFYVLSKNIHSLSYHTGLHETERIYRNRMAPSTHVRWILVFSLRLWMRCGSSSLRATSGIHEFSQFLAWRKTLQEIWTRVYDWPHQSQSLHQYKNLGENWFSNHHKIKFSLT